VIHDVKSALVSRGFYDGQADQIFSADLVPALEEYQRAAGLSVDGVIGPESLRALEVFPCRYLY